MRQTFIWTSVAGLLALFFVLVWYGLRVPDEAESEPTTPRTVHVALAWLHQAQFAGMYVAKEQGMYADRMLDVRLNEFQFGQAQAEEIAAGRVDFAVMSATEFLSAVGAGEPIVAVAAIYQVSPYAFGSLRENRVYTPEDFRGKVLGNEGGNVQATVTYHALMNLFGVSDDSVRRVNLNFDEAEDLKQRRADVIDLYRTDQPYVLNKAGIPYNMMFPEQFGFGMYGDVLVTSRETVEERPDLVRDFVAATLEGWRHALDHSAMAVDDTMKYATGKYAERDYEQFILDNSVPLIRPVAGAKVGSMTAEAWAAAYKAMESAGLIEQPFDVSLVFTNEFIDD